MTISKEVRLANIHAEALAEFDEIQEALRSERLQCLEDRRFYSISGAQWEGPLNDQFENKPRFEMNKVHLAVIRIISEYRNNRITVDFTAKDGEPDEMAEVCDGLYRADEQDSTAEEAYDNAFEEAVGGGFGAWRLRSRYENEYDDEDTRQRICIEPIFDADSSVFFDLNAHRLDKADATRCYVLTAMSPSSYMEEWDDNPASWPKTITNTFFDWCSPNVVYVCEFYKVEEKTEIVHIYRGLDGIDMKVPDSELKEDPEKEATLLATGFREVRQKKVKRRQVHKYIMSGGKILADEGIIAGSCIPIVPVYGKRWFVDNVERCMGHVRLAKDAQRLANMLRSNLGELAAQSGREKPIFTPQQVAGHSVMWAEDNIKEYPYLLVNPITDANGQQQAAGPIGYTKPPTVPPALAALMQVVEQDLQDLLGNQSAGEQMVSNIAENTVAMIQQRLDMQVFIYMSNLAKSMRRSGQIWLSMSKDLIVEEKRKMKTVDPMGETGSVEVNAPSYDNESGDSIVENDMTKADFDVNVEVGPSSSTRRAATVKSLTGLMQITQDPQDMSVLGAMAAMNMDGEGIQDVRDYFRKKLVMQGVVKPTDEEKEMLAAQQQSQQPDPNALYLLAGAKKQDAEAEAVRAGVIRTLADAELRGADVALRHAQTAKTAAEVGETQAETMNKKVDSVSQGVETIQSGDGRLADVIAQLVETMGQKKPSRIAFERDDNGDIIGAAQIPQE